MSTVADDAEVKDQETIEAPETEATPVEAPIETASETKTAEASDTPTPEETAPSTPEWLTDELRDVATSYGLGETELLDYETATEFQRACRLVDRLAQGRSKPDETVAKTPPPETPVTPAKPAVATPVTNDEDVTIDLAKYDGYDDDTLRLVKAAKRLQEENRAIRGEVAGVASKFEQALAAIQQERDEEAAALELSRFHEVMDGMDEKMFGGNAALTPELDKRREAVWESYKVLRNGSVTELPRSTAQRLAVTRGLVHRAALLAFGEEMLKSQRDAIHRNIHEQSKKRRPVPSKGKAMAPAAPTHQDAQSISEAARAIANSPKISSLYDKYVEDNGNVPQ